MSTQPSRASRRIHRILVGFDGSAAANEAVRLALDLAAMLDAELTLIGVLNNTKLFESAEDEALSEQDAKASFTEKTAPFVERANQLSIIMSTIPTSSEENPADLIARHAQAHGFDLIVVGNHGEDQIFHGGLGKVLEKLLRHSQIPVLVVPAHSSHI
ncbi:MAG: universal stress protein [Acidimicrobiaceae bacterium]|nr:universal stress protein [Acidimicrobiaceae bacterium]